MLLSVEAPCSRLLP